MITILSALVSLLSFRVRSRAAYNLALQARLLCSRRSEFCIIVTNDAPRELLRRPNRRTRFGVGARSPCPTASLGSNGAQNPCIVHRIRGRSFIRLISNPHLRYSPASQFQNQFYF